MLIAKGTELIAKKIIDIAKEHGVPVLENAPVARALFKMVELNHTIPPEMYKAIAEIHEVFNKRNIKHKVDQADNIWLVRAGMGGKASTYDFLFIKTDDVGNDVAVRVFKVAKFSESARDKGLEVINEIQQRYRYARFNLDDDGDVNVEYDFPAAYPNIGEGAFDMLIRLTTVMDECYPQLMRAVWG
jgi:type III secretion system FlhB-like substrate exporter